MSRKTIRVGAARYPCATPSQGQDGDGMEILQTVVSALWVASVGLILARLGHQRFDSLEGSVARVEQRLDARIDGLDRKFDTKIDGLDRKFDTKVDSLRAELTQIALAVGVKQARGTG